MISNLIDKYRKHRLYNARLREYLSAQFPYDRQSNYVLVDMLANSLKTNSSQPAIIFEDQITTYRDLEEASNRVANWCHSNGLGAGNIVALCVPNCPEFFIYFLGLAKAGLQVALLNTSISGEALLHCLNEVETKCLFIGADLDENFQKARAVRDLEIPVMSIGGDMEGATRIDGLVVDTNTSPVNRDLLNSIKSADPIYYLYTSGTTGLPKAARVSHARVYPTLTTSKIVTGLERESRLYVTLPVFHGTGLICSMSALYWGATIVLRRKFSASQFWEDCYKYEIDTFVYVGELMRYLTNSPKSPYERLHKVRSCGGNGLRPDVWTAFVERFNIRNIVEFYGSSEGNFAIHNLDGTPGTLGRVSQRSPLYDELKIVRYDVARDELVRDTRGRLVLCNDGEPGEAIRLISSPDSRGGAVFEGYTNKRANESKIVRSAFVEGDAYYRSGDLLKRNKKNYYFFVDRVGDTFRWKGENVSTGEVEKSLNSIKGVEEANVYGVQVDGYDGRAGMAKIVATQSLDLNSLAKDLGEVLPPYAIPIFLRIGNQMTTTDTHKHRKVEVKNEGFDPAKISDDLYFLHPSEKQYRSLEQAHFEAILSHELRL